jgi:hypothetical protein
LEGEFKRYQEYLPQIYSESTEEQISGSKTADFSLDLNPCCSVYARENPTS